MRCDTGRGSERGGRRKVKTERGTENAGRRYALGRQLTEFRTGGVQKEDPSAGEKGFVERWGKFGERGQRILAGRGAEERGGGEKVRTANRKKDPHIIPGGQSNQRDREGSPVKGRLKEVWQRQRAEENGKEGCMKKEHRGSHRKMLHELYGKGHGRCGGGSRKRATDVPRTSTKRGGGELNQNLEKR